MSNQIRMSPAELEMQAKRYGSGANEIRDTLRRLRDLQEELRGQWEGRAFVEFDNQFVQLSGKSEEFASLLDQIQVQLEQTSRAMAEQDEALSKNFGLY